MTPSRALLALLAALSAGACAGAPGASSLPEEAMPDQPPPAPDAGAPAGALPVEPLEHEGVRGGRIVFALPGTPRQVLEMLLDFEGANGRRPWADRYEPISEGPGVTVSRWRFEGRLGIHPTLEMVHRVVRREPPVVVTFAPRAPAFGLAAFFGDHRVWPLGADRSLMASRIFIDSGLPFVNASREDIRRGLRSDAAAMRAWMRRRLGSPRRGGHASDEAARRAAPRRAR